MDLMIKCRSPRSLVLGIRNLLWFLVRSEYAISVHARERPTVFGIEWLQSAAKLGRLVLGQFVVTCIAMLQFTLPS